MLSSINKLSMAYALVALLLPVARGVAADERVDEITNRLLAADRERDPERRMSVFVEAAQATSRQLPENVLALQGLQTALADARNAAAPADERASQLRGALREARSILTFAPINEAPLPEGYPAPTPLGEIRVKQYPAYRRASTASSNQGQAFMTLFRHIEKEKIAMTAPVEMEYRATPGERPRQLAMAFLYRTPQQGQLGRDGKVDVADAEPLTTVAIGMRGDMTTEQIEFASGQLQKWLAKHAEQYTADGDLRVLGYNSPFVNAGSRYFEVEQRVHAKE